LREVSAVVSEMNAPNLELTSETVLCHEHVVEFVMKAHTVLPVRFGTVLGSVHCFQPSNLSAKPAIYVTVGGGKKSDILRH